MKTNLPPKARLAAQPQNPIRVAILPFSVAAAFNEQRGTLTLSQIPEHFRNLCARYGVGRPT